MSADAKKVSPSPEEVTAKYILAPDRLGHVRDEQAAQVAKWGLVLKAQVVDLERERDAAKQEGFNQANIAKMWELRCLRAETARDALRAQVAEACRGMAIATRDLHKVTSIPSVLALAKQLEALASTATPSLPNSPEIPDGSPEETPCGNCGQDEETHPTFCNEDESKETP